MAETKKRYKKNEIVKGKVANALTSAAINHILATTDDLYDTDFQEYQDEINKRLDKSVSDLNTAVTAIDERLTEAEHDIDNLEDRVTTAEHDIDALEDSVSELNDSVSEINSKIPEEASSSNQLADKQFVIDLIHSTSSAFRGNWEMWDVVPTDSDEYPEDGEGNRIPRQGDYIVIVDASEYVGEDTGKTYEGTWRFVYEGEWDDNNKNGWKPEYQINEKPEITVHFRKKKEGQEESTPITDVRVSDSNALLRYPELDYSEFVNGGYWDTNIATLRQVTGETTVYYITPFMTSTDNRILLKICYENGWSSSPDYITLNEIEGITDEMVAEAAKKLALIEDEHGNIVPVFDSIIFEEDEETNIVMTSYNLYEGKCWDKYDNEYDIRDCVCYGKNGVRYGLDEVKYGNCFYELESWNELPEFTGITKLGDGETYRVFLDYSRIREVNLENITSLPKYTLFRCIHLENLFIPSGLTDIETYAIASCDGLQSLVVDENNPKYTSRDSNGNECNCIVEKPANRGRRSAINNQLTLIQGCNVTTLPDNIKHIASGAFDECTRLSGITLPDGLLTMGDNVFRGCTALSGNILVPNTVESIGVSSFMDCTALNGVNINVPVISEQLFKGCSSLSNVTLGNNVTTIGKQAFMNDSSLTAITIPDSVTVADTSAFMGCDLRNVNTNNIETISVNLFANNTHLSAVTMTDSTVTIGNEAFANAVITAVTIPQNVRSISNTAFSNCNNLQSIVWDNNDTTLSGYANRFVNNANSINNFEFGEHCTVIPNNLCASLVNIDEISIPNTITNIGNGAFYGCNGLTSVVIPDDVTSLGVQTFGSCNSLETVTIGNGITELNKTFANCVSLETVDLSGNERKINNSVDAFQGCDNLSLIIVPDNLITDYRESEDWYDYKELIFGNSIYTITFDSLSGETTPSVQHVRCGAYIEDPGSVHKDLYEFEYWEDEDGNEWVFDEDYVAGDMTLYAHYSDEIKAIMVKSISNDVTNISMSYNGSYPANVEYSYDGINWYNIWSNNSLTISTSEGYSEYVYFRGYNPDGFSRDTSNYTRFYINYGQCNLLGNIMYLKDYNQELSSIGDCEFAYLFLGCGAFVDTSELLLSAEILGSRCYYYMFNGCTSLTTAPELPATTLANRCYEGMFTYCTSLTTAPELPATTLADWCYQNMFNGCTNLTTAPELPATTLADGCYNWMFQGCTSLTTAPELPATTLIEWCYSGMFTNCSSLTTAPELPATTLSYQCYYWMFQGCTSLTTAPELPATTLIEWCYSGMFANCSSLTTAPELPATTLANYCYYWMFQGCTSLTTAPELPATTLIEWCYSGMFYNCSNLNYIKCLAVNGINQNNSTSDWVNSVASSGTFIKHPFASWDTCSNNGIPCNWTTEDIPVQIDNYITFTSQQNGSHIGLNNLSIYQRLWYSDDSGETWNVFNTSVGLTVDSGDSVYMCGILNHNNSTSRGYYTQFYITGKVSIGGNLNSIWNYDNLEQPLYQYCGYYLFYHCSGLVDASELTLSTSATALASSCYRYMFQGCTSLTTVPELPATTLASNCYSNMFRNCSSLTTAPELPATTLASSCYEGMFDGCSCLTAAPELPATTLASSCYSDMFGSCTSLTTAPELPATTLADWCYEGMFEGCRGLIKAPELPATTLVNGCYYRMFYNCSRLTTAPELPATTLTNNCYSNMFYNCSNLNYIKCLAVNGINQNNSTSYWVQYIGESGVFEKHPDATDWTTGVNGIPNGWAIPREVEPTDEFETDNYLTFTSSTDMSYVGIAEKSTHQTFYFSRDGEHWENVSAACAFEVTSGYPLYVCGVLSGDNNGEGDNSRFLILGNVSVSGNINSLWNCEDLNQPLYRYCGYSLFYNCSGLVDASELTLGTSATTLAYICYGSMFYNCTSLTTAPELPALTLADECYVEMFSDCQSLTTAPSILPAITLPPYCYSNMFRNCTSLEVAPEILATDLHDEGCCSYMFAGCTSLTTAPSILPALYLVDYCYSGMFINCTSLTTAPELPATDLVECCYNEMFDNCTNLNYIKCLAVNGINQNNSTSYWVNGVADNGTFIKDQNVQWNYGESGIPNGWLVPSDIIPYNPTTTFTPSDSIEFNLLGNEALIGINRKNKSHTIYISKDNENWMQLTKPSLIECTSGETVYVCGKLNGSVDENDYTRFAIFGDTSVSGNINSLWNYNNLEQSLQYYYGFELFAFCNGLVDASGLIIGSVGYYSYPFMFYNCRSLTTAPELPATNLSDGCYNGMFYGCTSLTTAPELPANTIPEGAYSEMFYNCSSLRYIKCLATNIEDYGTSSWVYGLPQNGVFVKNKFMNEWGRGYSSIPEGWTIQNTEEEINGYLTFTSHEDDSTINIDSNDLVIISTDNGENWSVFYYDDENPTTINNGETVLIAGKGNSGKDFNINGKISVSGNLNSLFNYETLEMNVTRSCCYGMFSNCTGLINASELILGTSATTLANNCYEHMFEGCTNLTTAPELPATTLANYCYYYMFKGCTSLTTAPELPATTLAPYCYESMFQGCTSLTTAPELPATTLADWCYQNMFNGCTNLTTAPELPATELARSCYSNMFNECTSLTTAPELPATTLAQYCYYRMFYDCTSLNYIKCLAVNGINQNSSTSNWVSGVQTNSGTFIKHPDATSWPTGNNGIPQNWTVEDAVIE